MKALVLAAVAAAPLVAVPGHAMEERGSGSMAQSGVFVGARVRIPLGSRGESARPQAGFSVAMERSYQTPSGQTLTRRGEGLGLDFASGHPVATFAGLPVSRAFQRQGEVGDGKQFGLSTTAIVGIGAVVLIGGVLVITQLTCIGKDKDYCGSD